MNILIVEDREHNLNASIERLREEGHRVVICTTATSAIEAITGERVLHGMTMEHSSEGHFVPEMVLTDMELPFGSEWHGVYQGTKKTLANDLVQHAGLAVAVAALRVTQRVGILTDTDHHHGDPIQWLLDAINFRPVEPGEDPEASSHRIHPIVRVEARNCDMGEVEIPPGDTCAGTYEYSSKTGKHAPIKDWHRLAHALMPM